MDYCKIYEVILTILLLLSITIINLYAVSGVNTDWSDPEMIDIYNNSLKEILQTDLDDLRELAIDAYNDGDYEKSAQYYIYLLRYDINDFTSIYNLACCYGLLGEAELAATYLKRAVIAGFDNIEFIEKDRDFNKVRGEEVFDIALNSMRFHIKHKMWAKGEPFYVKGESLNICQVHLPEDYNTDNSYPLIVCLHGHSGNPGNFEDISEIFTKEGYIFAVPTGPYPVNLGKYMGHTWIVYPPTDEENTKKSTELTECYIKNVVSELKDRYNTDKTYLMGMSQGAYITYNAGIKYHDLFDGLICLSGWLYRDWFTEEQFKNADHLRIFISHGKKDKDILFEEAENAEDVLSGFNYDITFFEFEGGHEIPPEVFPDILKWLSVE